MSKTTTISSTKNSRGAGRMPEGASHHAITVGKGESKRQIKDSNILNLKNQEGHVLGDPNRGRNERRVSTRNSGDSKAIRNAQTENPSKTHGEMANERKASKATANNVLPKSVHLETQRKVPIEDYYRQAGLDYRLIRKNCKIRVNGEGPGSNAETGVYYDTYQLPEGYTAEDLPDSQGLSGQNHEDPISPAVMIAAHQKKARSKVMALTPETDSDEIIRRIHMSRRKRESEANPGCKPRGVEPQTGPNETFPDDSLNDSDLVMASQQVESEHANYAYKDAYKRDINGNSKNSSPHTPLTSTPLQNPGLKNVITAKETPKTARTVSRSRHRSNANNQNDIFENSVIQSDDHRMQEQANEADDEAAPRKLLKFDASPIKTVELRMDCNNESGEFEDDGEDEILSQIPMPGEMREPKEAWLESSSESVTRMVDEDSNSKSDADTDCEDMDSFLDDNAMAAIAQLEAIHCSSSGSTGPTGKSPAPPANRRDLRSAGRADTVAFAIEESPRTRSRRQGLSRKAGVQ